MKYENLFAEGRIGSMTMKNRIILPAMGLSFSNRDGTPSERTINYYSARAKGGAGLIITGITRINDENAVTQLRQMSLAADKHILPFKKLVDQVHRDGARIFPQLHHPGRQTYSLLNGNKPVLAPSNVPSMVYNQETKAMTLMEIHDVIKDYIDAAYRAREAGADGIELHASHGYLIQQFLSPHTNRREDEYGGSFEGRVKFITDIINGIRQKCGDDYPISVRLTVEEFYDTLGVAGGIKLDEGVKIAEYLEGLNIDMLNISCGTIETVNTWAEPYSYNDGWRTYLSQKVRESVKNIPLCAAAVIKEPEMAERLLADGIVDFIALGRAQLADAEWANKSREGVKKSIRPCISCLYCFESLRNTSGSTDDNQHTGCSVNSVLGEEGRYRDMQVDGNGLKVAVIGGGPAGLEASIVLGRRGFDVTLFEKEEKCGGQLIPAGKPAGKQRMQKLIDYMVLQAVSANVTIRTGKEATVEMLKDLNPHAIFVAMGGKELIPPIKGIDSNFVCTAIDVIKGKVKIEGKDVIVVGSGMTGLETAEFLSAGGNRVSVMEMQDEICQGGFYMNVMDMKRRLDKANVQLATSHKLVEIRDSGAVFEHTVTGEGIFKSADLIVLALGVKPLTAVTNAFTKHFENVKVIGDAREVGNIHSAIKDGFETSYYFNT